MPRRVAVEDDWEDDPDDGDGAWQPDDEPDDDETIPCPHCQAPVYEGAEQCPACGNYLSEEDDPPARKSWWIVLGAILCLLIACLWIMG
jgi:hypothetical protein